MPLPATPIALAPPRPAVPVVPPRPAVPVVPPRPAVPVVPPRPAVPVVPPRPAVPVVPPRPAVPVVPATPVVPPRPPRAPASAPPSVRSRSSLFAQPTNASSATGAHHRRAQGTTDLSVLIPRIQTRNDFLRARISRAPHGG